MNPAITLVRVTRSNNNRDSSEVVTAGGRRRNKSTALAIAASATVVVGVDNYELRSWTICSICGPCHISTSRRNNELAHELTNLASFMH